MQEWYILGVENGVLFREVSSVHECPHREREGFHCILHTHKLELTESVAIIWKSGSGDSSMEWSMVR